MFGRSRRSRDAVHILAEAGLHRHSSVEYRMPSSDPHIHGSGPAYFSTGILADGLDAPAVVRYLIHAQELSQDALFAHRPV